MICLFCCCVVVSITVRGDHKFSIGIDWTIFWKSLKTWKPVCGGSNRKLKTFSVTSALLRTVKSELLLPQTESCLPPDFPNTQSLLFIVSKHYYPAIFYNPLHTQSIFIKAPHLMHYHQPPAVKLPDNSSFPMALHIFLRASCNICGMLMDERWVNPSWKLRLSTGNIVCNQDDYCVLTSRLIILPPLLPENCRGGSCAPPAGAWLYYASFESSTVSGILCKRHLPQLFSNTFYWSSRFQSALFTPINPHPWN